MLDPADGGWKSRKLWLTILALNLVVVLGVVAAHWSALGPYLTTLVGGITSILGLYFGSSVAANFVVAKNAVGLAAAQNSLKDEGNKE